IPGGAPRAPLALLTLALLASSESLPAQTPIDEEAPWPRVRSTNGCKVTLHLPQVEQWTSNSFTARAAVEVTLPQTKRDLFGVVWFEAHGSVDHSTQIVTLDQLSITKARFPEAPDNGSNALAVVREVFPSGARTVSLDYPVTALGFAQAASRQGAKGLKDTPPNIFWVTNRTVLILIDGEPVLRPIAGSSLQRVVNTPALLIKDSSSSRFYLLGEGQWFAAGSLGEPWSLAQTPPPEVAALSSEAMAGASVTGELPRILVSTNPAELLTTGGLPDFKPIRGTDLQYAADSDNQLFFHAREREAYLLLSG